MVNSVVLFTSIIFTTFLASLLDFLRSLLKWQVQLSPGTVGACNMSDSVEFSDFIDFGSVEINCA